MSWEFIKDEDGIIHLKGQMEKMRQSIISSFKDSRGKDAKIAKTPGFPGQSLVKLEDEEITQESEYRMVLGKIGYFSKKMAPELCNGTRETRSLSNRSILTP